MLIRIKTTVPQISILSTCHTCSVGFSSGDAAGNAPTWQKSLLVGAAAFELISTIAPPLKGATMAAGHSYRAARLVNTMQRTKVVQTAEKAAMEAVSKRVGDVAAKKGLLPILEQGKRVAANGSLKFKGSQWKFSENPANLLKELPRDPKGRIYTSDNLRIRPEKHPLEPGDVFNPRHHGQYYHIETRRNLNKNWRYDNVEILKPTNYTPGSGTGFLPGEPFPGL